MDFLDEYRCRKTVKRMPLKAISSNIDGIETSRLADFGGRSHDRSRTCLMNPKVMGNPSVLRKINVATTWENARSR